MPSAIYLKTQVLPDHKIEIQDPNLTVGETVDVFVVVSKKIPREPISILDFIDQLPGQQQFKTAEDVDQYLRQERDSWDS